MRFSLRGLNDPKEKMTRTGNQQISRLVMFFNAKETL